MDMCQVIGLILASFLLASSANDLPTCQPVSGASSVMNFMVAVSFLSDCIDLSLTLTPK